jgi:hypothetical protein
MTLQRHVSFVDCPGHDILMATMLNGAAVMDAVLLLVAGNEQCPRPQTSEHLAAVEIMKLKNIIILQVSGARAVLPPCFVCFVRLAPSFYAPISFFSFFLTLTSPYQAGSITFSFYSLTFYCISIRLIILH